MARMWKPFRTLHFPLIYIYPYLTLHHLFVL
jgi:hypothetical protein